MKIRKPEQSSHRDEACKDGERRNQLMIEDARESRRRETDDRQRLQWREYFRGDWNLQLRRVSHELPSEKRCYGVDLEL